MEATETLLLAMRMAWSRLEALYVGTGARYLTVQRLSEFLSGLRQAPNPSHESGGEWVTFDRGYAEIPGLSWDVPRAR